MGNVLNFIIILNFCLFYPFKLIESEWASVCFCLSGCLYKDDLINFFFHISFCYTSFLISHTKSFISIFYRWR